MSHNQTTGLDAKYRGYSRAELRRRACMFYAFAEQAGRDLKERNECERMARELEAASEQATS